MKFAQFASTMQALDRHTIRELGIPSLVLMERASLALANAVKDLLFSDRHGSVVAVCGTGNNGGDGAAAARILKNQGIDTEIVVIGNPEKLSEDLRTELLFAGNFGVPIFYGSNCIRKDAAVYIDALFGIGLCREVTGDFAVAIQIMNEADGLVAAADIPSGISADTGQVLGTAVRANLTVSMQYGKPGLFLDPGRQYAGELRIAEIGIAAPTIHMENICQASEWDCGELKRPVLLLEKENLSEILPKRTVSGNKGTFGKIVLLAGSRNMCGAAILSARAALRTGAGMVKIVSPECNREILQISVPEALLSTYTEDNYAAVLKEALTFGNIIAAGPGLGTDPIAVGLVRTLLEEFPSLPGNPSLVLDADALNIVAKEHLLDALPPGTFLTPHIVEMSRLCVSSLNGLKHPENLSERSSRKNPESPSDINDSKSRETLLAMNVLRCMALLPESKAPCGRSLTEGSDGSANVSIEPQVGVTAKEIAADRLRAAERFAKKHRARLILKDARTVIASDGQLYINLSGTDGMATAGSGDVLTGILAGLLAQGSEPSLAAPAAAFLHGLAGEKAANALGRRSMTAMDLCTYLPEAFREVMGEDF